MKENIIQLRELEAHPGKVLTNGEIYGEVIYLGINDSAANYYEITIEEYQEILNAQPQPEIWEEEEEEEEEEEDNGVLSE